MRRGQMVSALRLGEYLIDYDEGNAWRTLATVLVEDIGFGDLDLLAYGTITTLKAVRNSFGGEAAANRLFGAMVVRACLAPKSRSCCELSLGAEMALPSLMAQMRKWEEAELLVTMRSDHSPLEMAYMAACALRKNLRGLGDAALVPALQFIMAALDDPGEARACMMSFERTVDTMNLALFPIINRLNHTKEYLLPVDETGLWPEEVLIKSVSSAAFDMHTGIGARAIKALYNRFRGKIDWADQIISGPETNPMKALGSLVFIVEGGLLDTRLMSSTLADLKLYQDKNFAKGYGVAAHLVDDPAIFLEVLEGVHTEIPLLNELRQWSAKK